MENLKSKFLWKQFFKDAVISIITAMVPIGIGIYAIASDNKIPFSKAVVNPGFQWWIAIGILYVVMVLVKDRSNYYRK